VGLSRIVSVSLLDDTVANLEKTEIAESAEKPLPTVRRTCELIPQIEKKIYHGVTEWF
jgi:hypothetical protein